MRLRWFTTILTRSTLVWVPDIYVLFGGKNLLILNFQNFRPFPSPPSPFEVGFDLFVRRYSMYLPFIPHARKLYSVCTGKPPWPTFKYYVGVCLEGLRKSKKNSSHSSRRPGRQERYHLSQISQWFSSLLLPACTLNCSSIYFFACRASFFPVCNIDSPPQTAKNRYVEMVCDSFSIHYTFYQ